MKNKTNIKLGKPQKELTNYTEMLKAVDIAKARFWMPGVKRVSNKTFFNSILIFLIIISSLSCSNQTEKEIIRGVYFWKTNFLLSDEEKNWLTDSDIKKLFIRFFDVDWNYNSNAAIPVGNISIQTNELNGMEIIPVVFITNRTLKNIPDSLITVLSENIFNKILSKSVLFKNITIKEIQLDCDWTISTREKYFRLIEKFKRLCSNNNTEVTVTLRLHQIKYFDKTGVPPVKRGSLMFYNMSDVSDIRTKNSIFNKSIAENYLVNFDKYPLELDAILPAFSWGCLFRGNKLISLVNDIKEADLENNSGFIKETDIFYRSKENQYFKGFHILNGDYLRIEEVNSGATLTAARILSPFLESKKNTISLYHLNGEVIKNYDKNIIANIFSSFN